MDLTPLPAHHPQTTRLQVTTAFLNRYLSARARRRPHICAIILMVILVAATAACGLSGSSDGPAGLAVPPKQVQVDARRVNGLGTILVTSAGHVLYMFPPDSRQKVTCTGGCAGTWPPVRIAPGGRVVAGSGITQHLLGTVPDPDLGGDVVTYNGWPLYTYEGDVDAGQATGQALNLDGAPWYVLRTSGAPLISASPATGAGS